MTTFAPASGAAFDLVSCRLASKWRADRPSKCCNAIWALGIRCLDGDLACLAAEPVGERVESLDAGRRTLRGDR